MGLNQTPSISYHYTTKNATEDIIESNEIFPSLKAVDNLDVRYGDGQYFSDIILGTKTPSQLGREFIGIPNQYKYTHFVAIDITGIDVIEGIKNVFVINGSNSLNISNRIVDFGKIECN